METNVSGLPHAWREARISEITSVNPTLDKAGIPDDLEISFVPMPAVQAESGIIDVSTNRKFSEVKKGYTPFREGDVLFAKITPCMENGKMAVVPEVRNGIGFGSTEFHVLRAQSGINAKYIYYYVSSQGFRREAEHNMSGAVGQRRVTTPYLSACEVPISPANKQHRIVAKMEELFSELDKGIENLKTARAQLKVYRQALLKHAFEGKLTAQWRAERNVIPAKTGIQPFNDMDSRLRGNDEPLETADAMLKRLQQERAQRHQQQLADWEAAGKQSSKPKAPKPLPPLTTEELAELPALPNEWGWVKLSHIHSHDRFAVKAGPFGSALKKEFYVQDGYKIYGQEQVIRNDFEYGDYFVDERKYKELASCAVKPFDILISLVGTIGKVLVLPETAKAGIINPRLVKISLNLKCYRASFFKSYFESSFLRSLYANESQGTTMDILNLGMIQRLPYPLCSVAEQDQIIEIIEERFSIIDQLDQTIITALQQAEALRQSILKKAFSGQLVPQDPRDEPASVLLARIKVERAASKETAKPSRVKIRL